MEVIAHAELVVEGLFQQRLSSPPHCFWVQHSISPFTCFVRCEAIRVAEAAVSVASFADPSQVDSLLNGYDSRLHRQTSLGRQRKKLSKHFSDLEVGGLNNSSSSFISSHGSELSETFLSLGKEGLADLSHLSKSPGNEVQYRCCSTFHCLSLRAFLKSS